MSVAFVHYTGAFSLVRLLPDEPLPMGAFAGRLCAITRTEEELSIICETAYAPEGAKVEHGWACLKVLGPLDTAMVGVMSSLSGALAAADISLLAISTFDTDYVLVREDHLEAAIAAWCAAGHDYKGQA
jgi:uncharacterized protein